MRYDFIFWKDYDGKIKTGAVPRDRVIIPGKNLSQKKKSS